MNPSRLARATAAAAVTAAVVAVVRRDSPAGATEGDGAAALGVTPARGRPPARMAVIAGCLTVILVLAIQVAGGLDSSVRPLLSVVFYLAVPGWAVVGWLDLEDEILNWTLAIGLSIAIGILTAEAMLWADAWNPDAAFACLASGAAILLGGQVARIRRRAGALAGRGGNP